MSSLSFPVLAQAGLVLVASQAWAEAARSLLDNISTSPKNTAMAKLIYAAMLTVIIIFVMYLIEVIYKKSQKIINTVKNTGQDLTQKYINQ